MSKKAQSKSNPGGRPLSYDPRLVHEIILKGIEAGVPAADLDAAFDKAKLCSEHNVKDTIRQERLEGLVQAVHEGVCRGRRTIAAGGAAGHCRPGRG